ncbi:sodium/potassium-transporting ATPase subunit beta-3-like [Cynoglossus semilaevis]|uniref:Sodium/potassium-transporting ATPase subunit beta n=1 Tax=Cynoglossus semilaevis TaxID=244447 RepID=A0A3P8VHJ3_CYNSE|nr:sodium/potassium-transporting ATPase subunit beta-3-like [Cynoglossus semilaevis]
MSNCQEQKLEQVEKEKVERNVKNEEVKDEEKEERKDERKDDGKKEKTKEKKEPFLNCLYNPRSGEFLGRTASSWGLILLFYLIFYTCLTGMFLLTMWVMLQTLDENVPTYQDRLANPGLVIRPHAAEISFNQSDSNNYNLHIQQLHHLLQKYNDSIQKHNDLCLFGEFTEQDDEPVKKVCQFMRSSLGDCSGLSDTSFGFAEGKPCIIIKMNRVIGLKPKGDPYINCTAVGERPLQMQYFPSDRRLDKMFFPYYGKKAHLDYVQPLVAVKLLLTQDDYNIDQTVECKVMGSDLLNDDSRDKFQGRVSFRVKVSM